MLQFFVVFALFVAVNAKCSGCSSQGGNNTDQNQNKLKNSVFFHRKSTSMNNQVLGMVRQWQDAFYGRRFASSEPERVTDYVKVAEGFGAKGYHCTNIAQFRAAFADALRQDTPVWIDCVIDREEKVLPMIPAGGCVQDTIMN